MPNTASPWATWISTRFWPPATWALSAVVEVSGVEVPGADDADLVARFDAWFDDAGRAFETVAWLGEGEADARMVMQVHDELVFEVAANELESVQQSVEHHMAGAAELDVPLVVDSGHGKDWDTAH